MVTAKLLEELIRLWEQQQRPRERKSPAAQRPSIRLRKPSQGQAPASAAATDSSAAESDAMIIDAVKADAVQVDATPSDAMPSDAVKVDAAQADAVSSQGHATNVAGTNAVPGSVTNAPGAKLAAGNFVPLTELVSLLRAARLAQGVCLAELHQLSGISRGRLSRIENRVEVNPTIGTLQRMAEPLGKRIVVALVEDELVEDELAEVELGEEALARDAMARDTELEAAGFARWERALLRFCAPHVSRDLGPRS